MLPFGRCFHLKHLARRNTQTPFVLYACVVLFLRLPNLGQTCYLNSAVQSLLTLKTFSQEIHSQHRVWSSVASAELIRYTDIPTPTQTHQASSNMTWSHLLSRGFVAIGVSGYSGDSGYEEHPRLLQEESFSSSPWVWGQWAESESSTKA